MTANNAILGLWAETSIHAGAGSSVEGVDLPIQREGHSGWPCIFGSSVKGALRAKAEDLWDKKDGGVKAVFGPESTGDKASEHAGALLVGDARLLLLPVRSLTGHFKWVTCPALLTRLARDAERMGVATVTYTVPSLAENKAVQQGETADLFLEEYKILAEKEDLTPIIENLSALSGIGADELSKQLVIVDDSLFAYLSRYTTPVAAHIAIDNEKKVVKKGALWYEESLPAETVLYITLSACKVRDTNFKGNKELADNEAKVVLNSITQTLFKDGPYLQIGGNETVGMGWFKVNTFTGA